MVERSLMHGDTANLSDVPSSFLTPQTILTRSLTNGLPIPKEPCKALCRCIDASETEDP